MATSYPLASPLSRCLSTDAIYHSTTSSHPRTYRHGYKVTKRESSSIRSSRPWSFTMLASSEYSIILFFPLTKITSLHARQRGTSCPDDRLQAILTRSSLGSVLLGTSSLSRMYKLSETEGILRRTRRPLGRRRLCFS